MTTRGVFRWPPRVTLAVGTVLAASVLSVIVEPLTHAAASPLFVAAVTASAWLGGPGCGLLATVLATLALDAVMGATWPSFTLGELLPHIFEPYRQGEGGVTRAGLGLGIAIVRQLVDLHGGRVEASSAGIGHGACFTVLLPALPGSASISPTTLTRTRSELPGR